EEPDVRVTFDDVLELRPSTSRVTSLESSEATRSNPPLGNGVRHCGQTFPDSSGTTTAAHVGQDRMLGTPAWVSNYMTSPVILAERPDGPTGYPQPVAVSTA